MNITRYVTLFIIIHTLVNGLHGLAHVQVPVALSLVQSLFVGVVVFLIPLVAAILLGTQFYRLGSWLLLGSIVASFFFGLYNHFIVISPDHVSQVASEGWGLFFQVTATAILIIDGLGCCISLWALRSVPQSEKIS